MIQTKRNNGVNVNYVVADPLIDDIGVSFKIGATVKDLGQAAPATVAANFNFADTIQGIPIGRTIVDGKEVISDIDKTVARDELYMLPDGTLHIGKAPAGAVWALQGSPPLLRNSVKVVADGIKRDKTGSDIWTTNGRDINAKSYRLAVGLTAARKLVIARTKQTVTLDTLATIMAELGCIDALNGDGGGSAYLWPADNGWGRKMGVALTITKGEDNVKHSGDAKPELIIDPGHGGSDPGASGNGITEKNMVLDISLYQYKRFKELGVPVALTRDKDISLSQSERTSIIKTSGAKYCMSNHINAAGSTTAAGAEIIHSIYSDGKLARQIALALRDAGQVLRPTPTFSKANSKGQDYYFMHRETGNVSTVINEYGFCSNAADAARLKAKWKEYAEAGVKAYCEYVGHKYVAPKQEETKPTTPPNKPAEVIEGMKDIAGHWAQGSIVKALQSGVMIGMSKDEWKPDNPLTRAQLAVVLDRLGLLDVIDRMSVSERGEI